MEVLRLDRTTFIPDKIIEDYNSMIWTERYTDSGEFELKTNLVEETWSDLPEMSLITLRDTNEVMYVETHSIETPEDGDPELTITGKSVDAFIAHRYLEGPYPNKKYNMARSYTPAQAASVVLWNCLVNPSVNDVTRIGVWTRNLLDTIPNLAITDSTNLPGDTATLRWLQGGQADEPVLRFLNTSHIGIRSVRPMSGPANVVHVTTDDKGIISYTTPATISQMRLDLYTGVDRTREQSVNNPVIFTFADSHIVDPKYLMSISDYETMAFVISSVGVVYVYGNKPADQNKAGFDRRVLWVDGGQPGDSESVSDFKANLPDVGASALEDHKRVQLLDGQISDEAPYFYNLHYALGDKVTLLGDYKFTQTMRVNEYIRTEDASGDRGYPGLVVVS